MNNQKYKFNIHLIGVGGVSMSGLAEYFASVGFSVSGSDRVDFPNKNRLENFGIKIYIGHNAENLKDAHAVVYSDAVSSENEELSYAKKNGLYCISRADALRMISENFGEVVGVCGCHGKTTVTCMLAHIFKSANMRFTAHIGGEDLKLGGFIINGNEVFLSEVCEFKKNINKFVADYAVCLNTGVDHMDCYASETELYDAYISFAKRAYKAIINKNDGVLGDYNCANAFFFSNLTNADAFIKNLKSKRGKYSFDFIVKGKRLGKINLSVVGRHSVENALAAAACANRMGISFKAIKKGLENFVGVKRRFEEIGMISKAKVVADYAHHPTEILACLNCAKEVSRGKVYILFQPHTYSRTIFLKNEFLQVLSSVENLALFKTFSARESYKAGGSAFDLHKEISGSKYFESLDLACEYYEKTLTKNDLLLVLGAGDIYYLFKEKLTNNRLIGGLK